MKKILTLLLVLAWSSVFAGMNPYVLGSINAPSTYLNDTALEGCLRFENNKNDSTGRNTSPLATLSGTPAYSSSTFVKGGSYSANVTTHWDIYTSNNAGTSNTLPGVVSYSAITVFGWARPSSAGTDRPIQSAYFATVNWCWELSITTGDKIRFRINDSTGSWASPSWHTITGGTSLSSGSGYFYMATWDGEEMNLYLAPENGAFASDATAVEFTGSPAYDSTWITWNIFFSYNLQNFVGYADDMGVYSRALSASEGEDIFTYGLEHVRD